MGWTTPCHACGQNVDTDGFYMYVEYRIPGDPYGTGYYCDAECLAAHLQPGYLPPEDRMQPNVW